MAFTPVQTCLKVSWLAIFLLFFQFGKSQYDLTALDAKLQQYQKPLGGSAAIMVFKDNKVVYSKAAGADFLTNTQAPAGRSGDWVTTALVMMFVDEGKIKLDDKVSQYLPMFNDYSKGYITIRQCLTNMTGIAAGTLTSGILKPGYSSLEEAVTKYVSKHEIQTNPGTEFRYGTMGIDIAARVIEVVGKRSLEQLAQQKLFRPLSMRVTTYQFDFDKAALPSATLHSSAADYLNFLAMLLNKGMFKGKRILSEKAIDEMRKIQINTTLIKEAPLACQGLTYGLGAWVLEDDGNGNATCLTNPGVYGIWPVVDFCRGYASVVFVKSLLKEQDKTIYMNIKSVIDEQMPCK